MKPLLAKLAVAAVFVFAAGQAAAQTYEFSTTSAGVVCNPGPDPNCGTATGTQTGVGSSTLSGNATSAALVSTLTVRADIVLFGSIPEVADLGVVITYTGGTLAPDGTFTYTNQNQTFTSCTTVSGVGATCSAVTLGPPGTDDTTGGTIAFDLTPGAVTSAGSSTFTRLAPPPTGPVQGTLDVPTLPLYALILTILGMLLVVKRRLG